MFGGSRYGAPLIPDRLPLVPYLLQGAAMHIPVTTTFTIEGYKITAYKGLVRGIIVRSPTIKQGFVGGLKSIVGGQISEYADVCEQTRQDAYDLMIQHAVQLGANAVVGIRYDATDVAGITATEVLCYGTAVVIEPVTNGFDNKDGT